MQLAQRAWNRGEGRGRGWVVVVGVGGGRSGVPNTASGHEQRVVTQCTQLFMEVGNGAPQESRKSSQNQVLGFSNNQLLPVSRPAPGGREAFQGPRKDSCMSARFASFVDTLGVETMADGKPAFVFAVVWSDGCATTAKRKYGALYKFHCRLLDAHPVEAGYVTQERQIPVFPGKRKMRCVPKLRMPDELSFDTRETQREGGPES
jgi:hypothetical protein